MAEEKPAAGGAAFDEKVYQKGLAENMGLTGDKPEEPEEKPEEPEKKEDGEEKKEEEEPDKGDETSDGDDDSDDDEPTKAKGDEKYSKAFRKLQQEESRLQQMKGQVIAAERALRQREAQIQKTESELVDFVKKVRLHPIDALLENGLIKEDDLEYISKQLYFGSKAAAADPKNRAESDRLRRERQLLIDQEEMRRELANYRQERENEQSQLAQQRALDAYTNKFDAAVEEYKSKTPLLAEALKKNPARTRKELYELANEISVSKKDWADPQYVLIRWVKERKALLAELGAKAPEATNEKAKSESAAKSKGQSEKSSKPTQSEADEAARERQYRKELHEHLGLPFAD